MTNLLVYAGSNGDAGRTLPDRGDAEEDGPAMDVLIAIAHIGGTAIVLVTLGVATTVLMTRRLVTRATVRPLRDEQGTRT